MDFAEFLPTFISESQDNLQEFEMALVEASGGNDDPELIGKMFRAVHSIKGGSGMFNASEIVEFAHIGESVLDLVRAKQLEMDENILDVMFSVKDVLERYLSGLEQGNIEVESGDEAISKQLHQIYDNAKSGGTTKPVAVTTEIQPDKPATSESNTVVLTMDSSAYMCGFRLEPLIMGIEDDFIITERHLTYHGPDFESLNPTECFLRFSAVVKPAMDEEFLEDLLSFSDGVEGTLEAAENNVLDTAIEESTKQNLVDEQTEVATQPEAPEVTIPQAKAPQSQDKLIKVSSQKLDSLVDEVGELITLKYQIKNRLANMSNEDRLLVRELDKAVDDLREMALSMRLTPVAENFNRFHRVVREAAKATDKAIELDLVCGDTELDRITIEKLMDPLTHIVRNSCDHGIEQPDVRASMGKPLVGRVSITASYKGSGVSVVIKDDGAGLNKQRILDKAIANGLIPEDHHLTDGEICKLIFHAGLSTAEKVTDLSGRGVGMDVVRTNIEQLGGRINIRSEQGQGTEIEIELPLTTAILNGFAVKSGGTMLVLQLDQVQECLSKDEFSKTLVGEENCIELRGEYIPKIEVSDALELNRGQDFKEGLVVNSSKGLVALSVDELLGELQTVVKPLDPLLGKADFFSGLVKMASGEIGFCLDLNRLVASADAN